MADKERRLRIQVVTPERTVLEDLVESVQVPGVDGSLGILVNHAPLVSGLRTGVLRFGARGGDRRAMAVSGGFLEVADNTVTVLADTAELGEEIDVLRAKEAARRAKRRLEERNAAYDFAKAERSLQKALTRLRAAGRADEVEGALRGPDNRGA